jgi:hypothetical protein
LIHIFDPAQHQDTLHFRISRRVGGVGVFPPYSNPPVNSSCAPDTHTHTTHQDILEISFDRVKSLHFSSLLLVLWRPFQM